jgi:hypothetical protein
MHVDQEIALRPLLKTVRNSHSFGAILSGMTKAEIEAAAKAKPFGEPAANAVIWLREIALQLAILNERNANLDKPAV